MKRMLMTVFSRTMYVAVMGIFLGGSMAGFGVSDAQAQAKGKKPAVAADSAQGRGIAAIVNNDIITVRDFEMRSKVALLSSRIADTPENRKKVQALVMLKLIEEHLQWQEAKRRGISVSDSEIAQGVSLIERQGGMPPGSLSGTLKRSGVDISTIHDQIRSDIAWMKLLRQQVAPRLRVTEQEVDERYKKVVGPITSDRVEYHLAEIFVSAEDSKDLAEARRGANELLAQLRKGVSFSAIAHQFSQGVSASKGGDMGWMREEALKPEIAAIAQKMRPGQLSEPIQVENGYYIILLRDRRGGAQAAAETPETPPAPKTRQRALPPDPAKVSLTMSQLVFPFPPNAGPAEMKAMQEQAMKARSSIKSCADIDQLAQSLGLPQSGSMGTVKASDLAAPLRSVIMPLKAGRTTPPLNRGDAVVVLMVCARQDPPVQMVEEEIREPAPVVAAPSGPPSRDAITNRIEDEKLDMEARRLMRDLRRSAFLDIRM